MMSSYSTNDELKFELLNEGFKIYKCYDGQARYILDEARSSGHLNLKRNETKDPITIKLVQKVIELLATEYIPEKPTGR